VLSAREHFNFRTLGEVKQDGEVKGQMGFVKGEKILALILEKSELQQIEKDGHGDYYTRS
jgi:hypothetical protein